jgi:magnesium transporter
MLNLYYKSLRESDLKILDNFKSGTWISVEDPDAKELEQLRDEFGLDEGLLTDAIDFYEVPRLEIRDKITYIFTRVPYHDEENRSRTIPLLVALAPDFVLTISQRPLPFLKEFLQNPEKINTTQKTNLVLKIFSRINRAYENFLTDINRSVRRDSIQLEQSQKINNKDIIEFLTFERTLNDFLTALQPTATILDNLLSGKVLKLYENDKELVEDLLLNTNQLVVLCRSDLKNIVNLRESYSIIATSNLNRVIKLLTAVTVIITIPTMIASFYGMNVGLPYQESPLAFLGIVVFTITVSFVLLLVFIKNRWL